MDIKKLISKMTIEEKASMLSGADFWHTKAVERLGIPQMMVSDGPHGLRKQRVDDETAGVNQSIQAVCFPAACALACSFDRDLIFRLGQALGNECQAENVGVILGPGANIKRSPLCGRNFEYFSEDPYLASNIAASHIKGVQSRKVGSSLKHFACNNQENRRMSVSEEIDERTLHEIYLAAFEYAIREAKPWTVMCSYNRINGEYSSENKYLLTDVLRDKWGYEGLVVSDWGAVNDRPKGVAAGLDLEMPSSGGVNDKKIVEAVKNGKLSKADLDKSCERVLTLVDNYLNGREEAPVWDKNADHELAAEIASQCMVLLKNDDRVLPLSRNKKIAFIGKFAKQPRFQGGGSSFINALKVTDALSSAEKYADVSYAQGYRTEDDVIDGRLITEAVELAKNSDVAVVFAGLTDLFECEGYDRKHMGMPECQNELIRRVAAVQPNTVVVLHNGSPVEMPWIENVKGILEVYLGGEGVGEAVCDVLFGKVNPSGKLAETFPKKLSDNPSYLNFPGEGDFVRYSEGIFVGYRYYDKKEMEVQFPFGHGLSYTTFAYSDLKLYAKSITDKDTLTVSVTVKNTGHVAGREVVQLYVRDCESTVIRPVKELKGFEKIELAPGESKVIVFTLERNAFAFYSDKIHDWFVESGDFEVMIGSSSRDIKLSSVIHVESDDKMPFVCTPNTTMGDVFALENGAKYLEKLVGSFAESLSTESENNDMGEATKLMMEAQLRDNPLRVMISFSDGNFNHEDIAEICDKINNDLNKK
ncbi:MAG: glycoside hydrolase family 3 C-terminal domain-containing protein [Ruminococcus sp.]|nr:glycoside hydrolase family 3 C-terminal domain-containing protein [Ruminococcus sp.]